jgi:diguanylate cyclase (GGDEF)-like protein/PAS domain S-box-containing protein
MATIVVDRAFRIRAVSPEFHTLFGAPADPTGATLAGAGIPAADLLETVTARAFADDGLATLALTLPLAAGPAVMILRFERTDETLAIELAPMPSHVLSGLGGEEWAAQTPLAWIRFSPTMRIEAWSARAEELFGWTFAEVVGRAGLDLTFVHPGDFAQVERVVNDLVRGVVVNNTLVNRNITKDGRVIHVAWFNCAAPRPDGYAIISLALDVSESFHARAAAAASERRFRSLFERNRDPVVALDAAQTFVDANAAAQAFFGAASSELVGRPIRTFGAHDERDDLAQALDAVARGEAVTRSFRFRRADGAYAEVELGGSAIDDEGATYLVMRDVMNQRRIEQESAAQGERIRELFAVAASTGASNERQIIATLETGARLLGMPFATVYDAQSDAPTFWIGEALPTAIMRLALATDGPLALDDLGGITELDDAGSTTVRSCIVTAIDVEGTRFGSLAFASDRPRTTPLSATDCDLVQLMGALTASALERRRSRVRLNVLAYNDALTDLPNRARLLERLGQTIAYAKESDGIFGVLFCDLDHFKDVNDTLGHAAGDRLLQIVGMRLRNCVDSSATVARMGGDEFAILVPEIAAPEHLDRIAERILAAIDKPFAFDGYEQFLSTSIGIASFPRDGTDADTLLKHADIAMYRAKERGRNTHQHFTLDLNAAIRSRITQELRLRTALAQNEFVVHYMPQIDLATGALVGVEALVRWQDPRTGLVPPDAFIPSAEMSGLIVPLGDWVIGEACRRVAEWQRRFDDRLRLAVNLSGRQFHRKNIGARIAELQAQAGLMPGTLEVEITETVAMGDAELSAAVMLDLRRAGVSISVDDFGTGYSSLGYLRRFAIDAIKIDKSFVSEVTVNAEDATIVRTIVAMAHALNLEIVAEGVETEEQRDFMRLAGCERGQGYFYSPALGAEEMTAYIERLMETRPLPSR